MKTLTQEEREMVLIKIVFTISLLVGFTLGLTVAGVLAVIIL